VDVRIGVTQTARDIAIELADDIDREALKAKIAFVEIGTQEGDRRIGFGG
jgi:hypothetical protein